MASFTAALSLEVVTIGLSPISWAYGPYLLLSYSPEGWNSGAMQMRDLC
jgi:hypothetical protein